MRRKISLYLGVALAATTLSGCANTENQQTTAVTEPIEVSTEETTEMTTEAPTEESYEICEDAIQINIKPDKTYQTISGFGAAFTWYADWLTKNKDAEESYDLLFDDLGLTTLRFRNTYLYDGYQENFDTEKAIYDAAKQRIEANGEEPTVLLTSWSPAGYLKSTGQVRGESTLAKDDDGNYVYDDLGTYFADAIEAYNAAGVPIDVLSIQNELEYAVDYDCCLFDPIENENHAGYAPAFLATYDALQERFGEAAPKMIGPESMTIDDLMIKSYVEPIIKENPDALWGIGHHLYAGGNKENPASFRNPMTMVYESFGQDYPLWQTEYYEGNFMQQSEIIMRALTQENVNTYIYWGGVWEKTGGLIGYRWDANADYEIHRDYYVMKHYSAFIHPGYTRVDSLIKGDSSFKMTNCTFISEDGKKMTTVVINPTEYNQKIQLNIKGKTIKSSKIIDSDAGTTVTKADGEEDTSYVETLFQDGGTLFEDHTCIVGSNCVVTIEMEIE